MKINVSILLAIGMAMSNFAVASSAGLPSPDFSSVQSCADSMDNYANAAEDEETTDGFKYENFFLGAEYVYMLPQITTLHLDGLAPITYTLAWNDGAGKGVSLCNVLGSEDSNDNVLPANFYSYFRHIAIPILQSEVERFISGEPFDGKKAGMNIRCRYSLSQPNPAQNCSYTSTDVSYQS